MVTRVNDGQMLFLANMVSKMKTSTDLGSRIAEVHNGSSLFTGDAGASNIRRYIIENDWLEAIVALPLNMFYNTEIATYIWMLTNRKEERRRGNVQLIDATQWFRPLRRNLGKKTCELGPEDIERVSSAFTAFEETEHSKIFPNEDLGYWKITVERPLRLAVDLSSKARTRFRTTCRVAKEEALADVVDQAAAELGSGRCLDFNRFSGVVASAADARGVRMTAKRRRSVRTMATPDPEAEPVIRVTHRSHRAEADPLRGRFVAATKTHASIVEYEPDSTLRNTEKIPMMGDGGIDAFLRREILPYAPDAWYDPQRVRLGYEVSFTRHFSRPESNRTLEDVRREILNIRRTTDRLLDRIEHQWRFVLRAVTRGLRPGVDLLPSGVPWLGDVPAHWTVQRVKTVAEIRNGATPKTSVAAYWDGDVGWITPDDLGALRGREIRRGRRSITEVGYAACGATRGPVGSVVLSTRAPIGHAGILGEEACTNQGCRLLVPHGIRSEYLYYVICVLRPELISLGRGTTFAELSSSSLGSVSVPVPPESEQNAIVQWLDEATADLDAAVAGVRREIELLQEYRTTLISEVVTGKVDIRGATERLPEPGGRAG